MEGQVKKVFEYKEDINGRGPLIFNWSQDYQFIAVAGSNNLVYILDKRGQKKSELQISDRTPITDIQWDKDNEYLAILQSGLNKVALWIVFQSDSLQYIDLDTPTAKASYIAWSKSHPILIMGTEKGSLIFYNKKTQKKTPTVGKHSKRISSADWNDEGLLLSGGADRVIQVSDYNSNPIQDATIVKHEPKNLKWGRRKTDDRNTKQRTILAVLDQKTLLMFDVQDKRQPWELVFEKKYGNIIDYSMFGDGYIVVAFDQGYVTQVSTMSQEIKEEINSERVFQSSLDQITTNDQVYKMAIAGENMIKIYNMADWKDIKENVNERIELVKNSAKITKLKWSQNGQVLVAANTHGHLYGFLTSIPILTSSYQTVVSILSSFTSVSIIDVSKQGQSNNVVNVQLQTEPQSICLSPFHIASVNNNVVYYYQWLSNDKTKIYKNGQQVLRRDYYGKVKQIKMNKSYTAVLSDGKAMLHLINEQEEETQNNYLSQQIKKFPSNENDPYIVEIDLTSEFLIMLDQQGKLKFYHVEEKTMVLEFQSQTIITKFFANQTGTRSICFDKRGFAYLFEASIEELTQLSNFPQKVENVFWDQNEYNLFCVQDNENIFTYTINKNNINGMQIQPVREILSIEDINQTADPVVTRIERSSKPLSLRNGCLRQFSQTGQIQSQFLTSHTMLQNWQGKNSTLQDTLRYFLQNIQLHKFSNCLVAAKILDDYHAYNALGRKCLEYVELEIAIKAFQAIDNLSMVMTIQTFLYEKEKNIVFGNVAMILNDYDLAQKLYLKSSQPLNALDTRCDIQDYVIALQLAKQIAPEQEPYIQKQLAQQMESQGHPQEARKFYDKGRLQTENTMQAKQHNIQCLAGVSRCSIKLGDIQQGLQIAKSINNQQILVEIAVVFENMKHEKEAAEIYESCGMLEKATVLYIQQKLFDRVARLIGQIQTPNILSLYAKALESDGQYQKAEQVYQKAQNWEQVINLNLNQLDNINKAKTVLREKCSTSTNAIRVAEYCEKKGNIDEALEFLILGGKKEEAFAKGQAQNVMDSYVKYMKDNFTLEERLRVAQFYEGKSDWANSGLHYSKCNNPQKSLNMYYKAGDGHIKEMIELVVLNKSNQSLIQSLQDYLTGEKDNIPKDPIYLLDFYFQIDDIDSVVKITLIIAQDHQEQGNYEDSHLRLFSTINQLKKKKLKISYDLNQKLMLVHSYILAKRIKKNNENVAYLLNRVSTNISQFPKHIINIMTNTVIFATKAENMGLAFKWAVECTRPENRNLLDERIKPRIEKLVLKGKQKETHESKSQCPFCKELINDFTLSCSSCQNQLPFCIASGKHIIYNQATLCPKCKFPANIKYLKLVLADNPSCPLCKENVQPNDLEDLKLEDYKQLKI